MPLKSEERSDLKESIKKILSADQEAVDNLPEKPLKREIKKIRSYEDEI